MAGSPPPPDGASPDIFLANRDDSVTNSDTETEMEMEMDTSDLEQSKTCDANCCDHSCGCKCGGCFCQVRTDIQINANQTTYSGEGGDGELPDHEAADSNEGGHGLAIVYDELSFRPAHDDGVRALAANLVSLGTDASASLPVAITMQRESHSRSWADSLIGFPSFHALQAQYAHESVEDRAHSNMQKYMASMHGGSVSDIQMEYPDKIFISPIKQQADARSDDECMFAMDLDSALGLDLARLNSNEVSSHAFSQTRSQTPHTFSDNVSAFLRDTGALFGRESQYSMAMTRSEYHIEPPMGFLPLVPECRHAAGCA